MQPCKGDTGPGPGAYFTQQIVRRPGGHSVLSTAPNAPAATIRTRAPDARLGAATPGPGAYDPRDGLLRRSVPLFTFKGVEARVRGRGRGMVGGKMASQAALRGGPCESQGLE
jgi:hypothetical protein